MAAEKCVSCLSAEPRVTSLSREGPSSSIPERPVRSYATPPSAREEESAANLASLHPMARSGLSEAVVASNSTPEKRCFRIPREHEATSLEPTETALRRRPAEERLVARKNNFERNPLEHPSRSERTARLKPDPSRRRRWTKDDKEKPKGASGVRSWQHEWTITDSPAEKNPETRPSLDGQRQEGRNPGRDGCWRGKSFEG